jgi:hypothetical protein
MAVRFSPALLLDERRELAMRLDVQLGRRAVSGLLAALVLAIGSQLGSPMLAAAQRQPLDPRSVALQPTDLPSGFMIVADQTVSEPLRNGASQLDGEVVGAMFRTVLERPATRENLESGPIRVGQLIARSNDRTRATFSLDAQREFNVRDGGFEVVRSPGTTDDLLALIRRAEPFVEYRIVAVRRADTMISTTFTGLSSALDLDDATELATISVARYENATLAVLAAEPPAPAPGNNVNADLRAVRTPTPTPSTPTPSVPPTNPPKATPTPRPNERAKPPDRFDDRLAQPWSELMGAGATTGSGEPVSDRLRRIVDRSNVRVKVGELRPNVGGELKSFAKVDGAEVDVVESTITINKDVMNESPRVLAAILAHEIVHAGQPITRANGAFLDCVEAEVEAYAVQAQVWSAFWGEEHRPGQTKWERSMTHVEETWRDSGEKGLRSLVREETGQESHSCIG